MWRMKYCNTANVEKYCNNPPRFDLLSGDLTFSWDSTISKDEIKVITNPKKHPNVYLCTYYNGIDNLGNLNLRPENLMKKCYEKIKEELKINTSPLEPYAIIVVGVRKRENRNNRNEYSPYEIYVVVKEKENRNKYSGKIEETGYFKKTTEMRENGYVVNTYMNNKNNILLTKGLKIKKVIHLLGDYFKSLIFDS